MEKVLLDLASANGIWAALYVFLFIYVLYDTKNREKKYQTMIKENQIIIQELSKNLGVVNDIRDDVLEIKAKLKSR